jgi:prepilin-type N-terminal cleavage/methylation domain-containing protein
MKPRSPRGFSLIELLIVVAVVAVLATIAFPIYGSLRAKAQQAACLSHLRIMHVGLATYMQDHENVWPQMPEYLAEGSSENDMWEWWYFALKDYGVGPTHWVCPAEAYRPPEEKTKKPGDEYTSSYIPTYFDEAPNTAFRWAAQPWVIERGQLHGSKDGPNLLMMDGSIRQGPSMMAPP